jgi:hypothetical protein
MFAAAGEHQAVDPRQQIDGLRGIVRKPESARQSSRKLDGADIIVRKQVAIASL